MQEKTDFTSRHPGQFIRSILVLTLIALLFVAWGFFIFFSVGDKLPYPWFYGSIDDVPASSPYSTSGKQLRGNILGPEARGIPLRQHVRGEPANPIIPPGEVFP